MMVLRWGGLILAVLFVLSAGEARAEQLAVWFPDPAGDSSGQIDLVGIELRFDNETGEYEVTFRADAVRPFTGTFFLHAALFNPDTGTTSQDPSFFEHPLTDASTGRILTAITLRGNNPRLLFWRDGHRVAVTGPKPLGTPDGTRGFESNVIELFQTDAIAERCGSLRPPTWTLPLMITEHQITSGVDIIHSPKLGNDGTSDLVVFQDRTVGSARQIKYQRLDHGMPSGPVVTISDGLAHDFLPDVWGHHIVYTAHESATSPVGEIKLHNISTGLTVSLLDVAEQVTDFAIHGDNLVWVTGGAPNQVKYSKISWFGTGRSPVVIAGSFADRVEIGDRFIVWDHQDLEISGDTLGVRAHDLEKLLQGLSTDPPTIPEPIIVSKSATVDSFNPSTDGPWVAWEAIGDFMTRTTWAKNMDTGETRLIEGTSLSTLSRHPVVSGDLVAYEFTREESGSFDIDIWVHRLSTAEKFPVIDDTNRQFVGDIFGNLVAYEDFDRNAAFVSEMVFEPVPEVEVAPLTAEFGSVSVGSSETMIMTVTNAGTAELTLTSLSLLSGGGGFSIMTPPVLPATIAVRGTLDLSLAFSPTAEGAASDVLEVDSDDPNECQVNVRLSGLGVRVQVPPAQQILDILEFIDTSVAEGTMTGSGPGGSSGGRLGALQNMLEAAGDLIVQGRVAEACDQLSDALNRTDGNPQPPDFVTGVSAAPLADLIRALRESLGCM